MADASPPPTDARLAPTPVTASEEKDAVPGPTVGLCLGAGAARGYAHIGVIQVLKERGYRIAAISGTSMGSLIGGLEAAAKLDDFTDWAVSLTQAQVIRLLDPALNAPGAIRAARILGRIQDLLDGVRIEELPVPYTAVATDLTQAREVWFREGPLDVAIRASIAIPSMITPIVVGGRLLVDGAVLNPVPLDPLTVSPTDLTVAVSINTMPRQVRHQPVAESTDIVPREQWIERFKRGAAGLFEHGVIGEILGRLEGEPGERRDGEVRDGERRTRAVPEPPPFEQAPSGLGILDVTNQSLDIMGAVIARYRMAAHPPDVSIEIPGSVSKPFDFHLAADTIAVGRAVATDALDRFEASMDA